MGDERRDTSWHVEKKVSIGHMLTTLMVAGGLIGVYVDMSGRQVKVEAAVVHLEKESVRIDDQHNIRMDSIRVEQKESVQKMDRNFELIQHKLDRLIERELNGK